MFLPINSPSYPSNNIAEANQKNNQVSLRQLETDMFNVFENFQLDHEQAILRFFNDVYLYERSSPETSIMPILIDVLKAQKIDIEIVDMLANKLPDEVITFFTNGKYKPHPQKLFALTYLNLALNEQWNFKGLERDAEIIIANLNYIEKDNLIQFFHNVFQHEINSNDPSGFLYYLSKNFDKRMTPEILQFLVDNLSNDELNLFTNKNYKSNPNKILAMTYLDLFFNNKISISSLQFDMELIFKDLNANKDSLLKVFYLILKHEHENPVSSFIPILENITSRQKIDRNTLQFLVDHLSTPALVFFTKRKYQPNPSKAGALMYLNLGLNGKSAFKPSALPSSIQESIHQAPVTILEPITPSSLSTHTFTSTAHSEGSEGVSSASSQALAHLAPPLASAQSSPAQPNLPRSPQSVTYSPTEADNSESEESFSSLTEAMPALSPEIPTSLLLSPHSPQDFSAHASPMESHLLRPTPTFPASSPSVLSQLSDFPIPSFPASSPSALSQLDFPMPSLLGQQSPQTQQPVHSEVSQIAADVFSSNTPASAPISSSQLSGVIAPPSPRAQSSMLPQLPLPSSQLSEVDSSNLSEPQSSILPPTPLSASHNIVPLSQPKLLKIPSPPFLQPIQTSLASSVSSTSLPSPSSPPFPWEDPAVSESSEFQLPPSAPRDSSISLKIRKKRNPQTGEISWSLPIGSNFENATVLRSEGESNQKAATEGIETNPPKKSKKRKAATKKTGTKKYKSMSYYDLQNFNDFAKDLITVLRTVRGLNNKSKFIASLNQLVKVQIDPEADSEGDNKTNKEIKLKLNEIFKLFLSDKNLKKFQDYMDVYADRELHIKPLKKYIVPVLEPDTRTALLNVLNTCNTNIFKNIQEGWENIKSDFSVENLTLFFKNLLHYRTTILNGRLTACEVEASEMFKNLTDNQIKILKKSFKKLDENELNQLTSNSYPFLARYLQDQPSASSNPSPRSSLSDLANLALASAPAGAFAPSDFNLDANLLLGIYEGNSLQDAIEGRGEGE